MPHVSYLSPSGPYVHAVQIMATAQDGIVANARAVLGDGETLQSAVWESDDQAVAGLVSATIDDDSTEVVINSQMGGNAIIRCQLTTSAGRKVAQLFNVETVGTPFDDGISFGGDKITVTAP